MKVTELQYEKRFNTAKYEHEEYRVTASVDEDDDALEVIAELKELILKGHAGESPVESEEVSEESESDEDAPKKKTRKTKATPPPEEEEETEEEDEDEVEETEEEEEDEKPAKKARAKRSKETVYTRTNDLHKKLFVEVLDTEVPEWKKKLQPKAKAVSIQMNGKDFLDEDGQVVDSFSATVRKLMKAK